MATTETLDDDPPRTLTDFLREVRSAAEFAQELRAKLEPFGHFDREAIYETAQFAFEVDVARRGSLKDHIALRRLRQADRTIAQRERAFEFNAAEAALKKIAELKAIESNPAMPHPDKIEAIRRHLFGAPPADHPLPTDDE